ncbi:HvfC/BufC N-terminal domain-containing protein [Halocynthiibacter styelae]|uniref:Putative DNA-binding domain-containing protein n=1 Tax=Halocynthiibacter styelae TaxID=2761955 RepID=A0A8J7IBQ4_9RHOB|nr:DNA-binding domain-containing protein [Paenihalocynthiibacter styelae]MBI1492478.1 putative DNA-binding domain-containing protein [Paenihalocynthiibacter styelae]
MNDTVTQPQFTQAILSPTMDVPAGLRDAKGDPAGKRFSVYRNNVAVSLTEALITAFPVVVKLLGEDNFRILAGQFLRAHPPTSPLMMHYGDALPDFLQTFEPTQQYGYLPDVARLELAIRESYHAADTDPISPEALQALPPEALMAAKLELAPSVRLISSQWPLFQLWQFNMTGGPKPEMRAEDVLITRPAFDPQPVALPCCGGLFVQALLSGRTFGEALSAASTHNPEFDLSQSLAALLAGNAISRITEG